MSQENVETLRGGFDAFARGDVDGVLERLDPDVDWSPAIGPILGVETVRGREALRRFLTRDLFEGFDQFGAEPLSIEDLGGEYVLVMVRYTGRGQSSGIEMDQTFASLYRMRDGKVVTMRDYPTRTEALEAAGLSESAMSQRNVEVVSRAIAAINGRDVDAYLALCDPDVELINPVAAIEGPNRGEAGIRNFFQAINEAATRFELEMERLQPLDNNRVLGFLSFVLETERGYRERRALTTLYELEGGKLLRVRVFVDHAEALEAAGLRE